MGLVACESRGNSPIHSIADPSIYALCGLVCGNLARQFERAAVERAVFVTPATAKPDKI